MTTWPAIDPELRRRRLDPPTGRSSVVLDTDTYNEVDDQFALVHAMLSPDRIDLQAIYAAPFCNSRSTGPADGMEKSYDEIQRLLERLGRAPAGGVHKGSTAYLSAPDSPVPSDAAADLVERAMRASEEPLYVVGIGAITNVASALLLEPAILEKIVVVWLGGHALHWPSAREFNLYQDVAAARLIFDCGVPVVHVPCLGVAEHLRTTLAELRSCIAGANPLADDLIELFGNYRDDHFAWAKELWDIATTAWLVNPAWLPGHIAPSPILTDQLTWSRDPFRHPIRELQHCQRNAVFHDLFAKIRNMAIA